MAFKLKKKKKAKGPDVFRASIGRPDWDILVPAASRFPSRIPNVLFFFLASARGILFHLFSDVSSPVAISADGSILPYSIQLGTR